MLTGSRRRTLLTAWSALLVVTLLLAWPAPVAPQAGPSKPDTIRLRFMWPVGTTASVETTRLRERITQQTETVSGGARYRMQVQQHPEGLLIVHDSVTVSSGAVAPPGGATLQAAAERLADLVPSYVVTGGGEFLRVHDVAGLRARMSSLFGSMLQAEDSTGRARAAMASLLTEDVLGSIATQEWNALVGMWVDADLELGETYEREEEAAIPLIPGATVQLVSRFSIRRRVPCSESGASLDCVEIHLLSSPEPEAVQAILRQFMERIASQPALANFAFERLDLENELVLIIEPATLRPHRARLARSVEGVVRADGKTSNVSQRDVRTYSFTYR